MAMLHGDVDGPAIPRTLYVRQPIALLLASRETVILTPPSSFLIVTDVGTTDDIHHVVAGTRCASSPGVWTDEYRERDRHRLCKQDGVLDLQLYVHVCPHIHPYPGHIGGDGYVPLVWRVRSADGAHGERRRQGTKRQFKRGSALTHSLAHSLTRSLAHPRRQTKLFSLAAAYVGYIVLCNLNLNINPVGFYQISKIAVAPAVLAIDWIVYNRKPQAKIVMSIAIVCLGVGLATVSDPEMSGDVFGLLVGLGSVLATALYQIWAGSIQKDLGVGSMQLLHLYVPLAAMQLGAVTILFEPLGLMDPSPKTILGYPYSVAACTAIMISAVLGLLVNLSTFLVIGATSSLTYNVVGHIKTVIILTGGVAFFGDSMSGKKFMGILFAMSGIVWYSMIKLRESSSGKAGKVSLLERAESGGLPLPSLNGKR